MKFSEAIRLGSLLRPQSYGSIYDGKYSCALGALMEGAGIALKATKRGNCTRHIQKQLHVDFFNTKCGRAARQNPAYRTEASKTCPACSEVISVNGAGEKCTPNITSVIIHLNNEHMWTRERIADWVQSIEDAHDTTIPLRQMATVEV
jgi:hypothetical protein